MIALSTSTPYVIVLLKEYLFTTDAR